MFYRLTFLFLFTVLFTLPFSHPPLEAETARERQKPREVCLPIPIVGGEGNTVTKSVSAPTIPAGPLGMLGVDVTHNNWNTDWAVPSENNNFRYYLVTLNADNGGSFDIKMYLKYSDQTADQFFNQQGITISPNQPLEIKAIPRPNAQPYQVNLEVNGLDALGKTYTASVVGCR